jgi:hypothetical protein
VVQARPWPSDSTPSTATAPDGDLKNSLDDLRDDVATLNAKVDAMMMAMRRSKRWADCAAHVHPALHQEAA